MDSYLKFISLTVSLFAFIWFIIPLLRLLAQESESKGRILTSNLLPEAQNSSGVLFQIDGRNIVAFKNRQWQVTYYTLALLGAIIVLLQTGPFKPLLKSLSCQHLIHLIALVLAEYGIYFITKLQSQIRRSRLTMSRNPLFRQSLFWMDENQIHRTLLSYKSLGRDGILIFSLVVSILGAYLIALFFLFRTINPCRIFNFFS